MYGEPLVHEVKIGISETRLISVALEFSFLKGRKSHVRNRPTRAAGWRSEVYRLSSSIGEHDCTKRKVVPLDLKLYNLAV